MFPKNGATIWPQDQGLPPPSGGGTVSIGHFLIHRKLGFRDLCPVIRRFPAQDSP
jgi:hypothetical protein